MVPDFKETVQRSIYSHKQIIYFVIILNRLLGDSCLVEQVKDWSSFQFKMFGKMFSKILGIDSLHLVTRATIEIYKLFLIESIIYNTAFNGNHLKFALLVVLFRSLPFSWIIICSPPAPLPLITALSGLEKQHH